MLKQTVPVTGHVNTTTGLQITGKLNPQNVLTPLSVKDFSHWNYIFVTFRSSKIFGFL